MKSLNREDLKNYRKENKDGTTRTGRGYIGKIECSYEKLIELFGESIGPSADNKCSNVWFILLDNGEIVTIYDWKISKLYLKEKGLKPENITQWNVGGKKKEHLLDLQKIIEGENNE